MTDNNIRLLDNELIIKRLKKSKYVSKKRLYRYYKPKYKTIMNLTGKIKVFDQRLHDRYDTKARNIIKDILGDSIIDNPNPYGEDMVVLNKEIPYKYIELQVYGKWLNIDFPYKEPYIYERKMRFASSTLFVCFNALFDKIIMFDKSVINDKKYKAKYNTNEYIHKIPLKSTMIVPIKNLNSEVIINYYKNKN